MIKRILIFAPIILALLVICVSLFQYDQYKSKSSRMEKVCYSSADYVLNCFKAYESSKEESHYIRGVAEFRGYMQAYFYLIDDEGTSGYLRCESLYVEMISNPEKVKAHIPELIDIFTYLKEDYNHPDGFNAMGELSKQLKTK